MDNWEEKKPGFLARSAPGLNAYVMAREVIQNAWDAAHELRESPPPPPPKSHRIFTFRSTFATSTERTRRVSATRWIWVPTPNGSRISIAVNSGSPTIFV